LLSRLKDDLEDQRMRRLVKEMDGVTPYGAKKKKVTRYHLTGRYGIPVGRGKKKTVAGPESARGAESRRGHHTRAFNCG